MIWVALGGLALVVVAMARSEAEADRVAARRLGERNRQERERMVREWNAKCVAKMLKGCKRGTGKDGE